MERVATGQTSFASSRNEGGVALLCKAIFAGDLFFQKITVPVDPHLPVLTALLPMAAVGALLFKILLVDYPALLTYFLFLSVIALEDVISTSTQVSIASLCLAVVNLFPLALKADASTKIQTDISNFATELICLFAIFGIIQTVLQGWASNTYLFPIDYLMPEYLLIKGYNNLNTLGYGSSFLKSNGIFLAEPSYLSQIVGLGLILELSTRRRLSRLFVLLLGLYSSFSGTGIVMIAVWSIYQAIRTRKFLAYILIAPIFVAAIFIIGPRVGLDALLSRTGEFADPNSSGFARFVSMFYVLDAVHMNNLKEFLFGRGSGTVFEYAWLFRFEIFDPTWGKVFYEFGLVGFTAFILFYFASVPLWRPALGLPITVLYFFLGGYFLDASIIGLLVSLVVWSQPRLTKTDKGGVKSRPHPSSVIGASPASGVALSLPPETEPARSALTPHR